MLRLSKLQICKSPVKLKGSKPVVIVTLRKYNTAESLIYQSAIKNWPDNLAKTKTRTVKSNKSRPMKFKSRPFDS